MAAPKGNKFWLLGEQPGRGRSIKTPDELWEKAADYFKHVIENPIIAQENKGTKNVNQVEFIRPFTQEGLCRHLNISQQTYRNLRKKKEFIEVVHAIDLHIRNQKFEGAAIGIFSHNIIARDLGLRDSVDQKTEHTGEIKFKPTKIIIEKD